MELSARALLFLELDKWMMGGTERTLLEESK